MDVVIQSLSQSAIVQKLSEGENLVKRFTHDIPDNAPYRSFDKVEVESFMGSKTLPDSTQYFKVPRRGYLNRMYLKVSCVFNKSPTSINSDFGERPVGPEFFAGLFESAELHVGGKHIETLFAENILYDSFKNAGGSNENVLYWLKGSHTNFGEDAMGDKFFGFRDTADQPDLPKFANFIIPLNFSLFAFHKDCPDTTFLSKMEVRFTKKAVKAYQTTSSATTKSTLVCKYHNLLNHFKTQIRNTNYPTDTTTLLTSSNHLVTNAPVVTQVPAVDTICESEGEFDLFPIETETGQTRIFLSNHGFSTGDTVSIRSENVPPFENNLPNPDWDGENVITVVDSDEFTLDGILPSSTWCRVQGTAGLGGQYNISGNAAIPNLSTIVLSGYDSSFGLNGAHVVANLGGGIYRLNGSSITQSFLDFGTVLNQDNFVTNLSAVPCVYEPGTPGFHRHVYNLDLDLFATDILITFRKLTVISPNKYTAEVYTSPSSEDEAYLKFILKANGKVLFEKNHWEMHREENVSSHDIQDQVNMHQGTRVYRHVSSSVTEALLGGVYQHDGDGASSEYRVVPCMYRIPMSMFGTDEFLNGGLDFKSLKNVELVIEGEALNIETATVDHNGLTPQIVIRHKTLLRVDGKNGSVSIA